MTLTNQQLADVIDGVSELSARLDALMGGSGKVRPYPRPEVAMTRARERHFASHINDIVSAVEAGQERNSHGRE